MNKPYDLERYVLFVIVILCSLTAALTLGPHDKAMATCMERYSFDTCHYALNR